MKRRPVAVTADVRINAWEVLTRAVELGTTRGWARAHKHTTTPGEEAIRTAIENAVMEELSEVLVFEGA